MHGKVIAMFPLMIYFRGTVQRKQKQCRWNPSSAKCFAMERIQDKANAERYDRMIEKRELEIIKPREQIENYEDMDAAVKKKRSEAKKNIDLLDEIIANGSISDIHLRMLVNKGCDVSFDMTPYTEIADEVGA